MVTEADWEGGLVGRGGQWGEELMGKGRAVKGPCVEEGKSR